MRRHPLAIALSAVPIVLAGCASSAGTDTPGGGTNSQAPELPADLVVFQVETGGGFVPIEYALGAQPRVTIYGDGTAFTTVEEDTYRPVVALRQGSVDVARLTELADAADSSGLFGNVDFGNPAVTDLGTTVLTFRRSEDAPRTASAYALGFGDGDGTSGVSAAQQELRHALSSLIDDLVDSVAYSPDGGSWTPTRVEVIDLADSPPNDAHASPWPGPDLTALLSRTSDRRPCGELADAPAATVFEAARTARSSTWTADNKTYHLLVRALLPGEAACAE